MKKQLIGLLLVLSVLAGCRSYDKMMATGYGLNIVTRDLSTELTNADKITPQKAIEIKALNDKVSSGLWHAWQIRKAYPDSSKASVKIYLKSIQDAFDYLKTQEVK